MDVVFDGTLKKRKKRDPIARIFYRPDLQVQVYGGGGPGKQFPGD
jgi:hypothetical protein